MKRVQALTGCTWASFPCNWKTFIDCLQGDATRFSIWPMEQLSRVANCSFNQLRSILPNWESCKFCLYSFSCPNQLQTPISHPDSYLPRFFVPWYWIASLKFFCSPSSLPALAIVASWWSIATHIHKIIMFLAVIIVIPSNSFSTSVSMRQHLRPQCRIETGEVDNLTSS